GGPVHAVAQADGLDLGGHVRHPPDVHGHRVRVVEEPRIGADLAHVARDAGEHREGAQRPEDTADACRVADGLAEALAGRQLEVDLGGRNAAYLDHVDHEV